MRLLVGDLWELRKMDIIEYKVRKRNMFLMELPWN